MQEDLTQPMVDKIKCHAGLGTIHLEIFRKMARKMERCFSMLEARDLTLEGVWSDEDGSSDPGVDPDEEQSRFELRLDTNVRFKVSKPHSVKLLFMAIWQPAVSEANAQKQLTCIESIEAGSLSHNIQMGLHLEED